MLGSDQLQARSLAWFTAVHEWYPVILEGGRQLIQAPRTQLQGLPVVGDNPAKDLDRRGPLALTCAGQVVVGGATARTVASARVGTPRAGRRRLSLGYFLISDMFQ